MAEEDWDAEICGLVQPVKHTLNHWQPSTSSSNQYDDGHYNNNNSLTQSRVYHNSAYKGGTRSDERPAGFGMGRGSERPAGFGMDRGSERPAGFGMGRGRLANDSSNGTRSSGHSERNNWRTDENDTSSKAKNMRTLSIESQFVGRIIGNAGYKKINKMLV
ncbi:hypothetical protein DPMN_082444 [Dreissena polymorpha]|uniref:Uncharacterized protein n=1 Tax=Dreissena polymorpha TaxID=45954 RepID=A0A9D3YAT0_DREPO|nr:hypothetical protein DPMN_082444 [Dreissena polymorpha]